MSFCGRFGFKHSLLLAQVMTETFSMLQVVKTYLKMFNALVEQYLSYYFCIHCVNCVLPTAQKEQKSLTIFSYEFRIHRSCNCSGKQYVTLNIVLFPKNCSLHSNNAELKLNYAERNKH